MSWIEERERGIAEKQALQECYLMILYRLNRLRYILGDRVCQSQVTALLQHYHIRGISVFMRCCMERKPAPEELLAGVESLELAFGLHLEDIELDDFFRAVTKMMELSEDTVESHINDCLEQLWRQIGQSPHIAISHAQLFQWMCGKAGLQSHSQKEICRNAALRSHFITTTYQVLYGAIA